MLFLRLIAVVLSTNILSTISSILVECVEITRLDVDTPIIAGEGGWLNCDWDERGDRIYTMKWYWGTQEFYRWTPKSENPILVFPLNAFKVDQTKSSKGHVFIKDVKLSAEGKFLRCEVSGEGPFFQTDFKEDKLTVVDLPDTRPRITGSLPLYRLHTNVVLTCTSPRSKPAASLAFYINGEKADPSWLIHHSPQIDPKSGLETAMLGIKFTLLPRLLHKGEVMVKCAATVKDLYWESNEQIIRGDVPLTASRMEERASSSSGGGIVPSGGNVREGLGLGSSFVISFIVLNIQRYL